MRHGVPQLTWVRPGGREHLDAVRNFAAKDGWITALADSRISLLRDWVQDDLELDGEVEVRSFAEIVRSLARACGIPIGQLATAGMVRACVAEACANLELEAPLSPSAQFPGTQRAITRTLRELHHWGIDATALGTLAEQASDDILAAKLRGLAQIDQRVDELLAKMGRERSLPCIQSSLHWLGEAVPPIRRLMVDATGAYEPISAEWLQWASHIGIEVIVLLEHSSSGGFELSQRMAQSLGFGNPASVPPQWADQLFTEQELPLSPPDFTLMVAPDVLSECEWAIRKVQEWQSQGVGGQEIVIFARDTERYAPLMLSAARRLGVILEANLRAPLLSSGFVAFTLKLLRAIESPRLGLLAELSTGSFLGETIAWAELLRGADRDAVLENREPWAEIATDSFQRNEWLDAVLRWRKLALEKPLLLKDWLDMLIKLMGDLPALNLFGQTAERDSRARSALQRALRDIAVTEQLGSTPLWLSECISLCEKVWDEEEMTIPAMGTGVRLVTNADAVPPCQKLIILGMLEGTLPLRRKEDPILSDEDRAAIASIRLSQPSLLDSHTLAREERSSFIRLASAASDELILSYPLTSDDRDNVPAYYLNLVQEKFGAKVQRFEPKLADLAPPIEECQNPADLAISRALAANRSVASLYLQSPEARQRASLPEGAEISPSEFRDALQCTFRAAAAHRLPWRPKSLPPLKLLLAGLPEETQLSARPLDDILNTLDQALEAKIRELGDELEPWETILLRLALPNMAENWMSKERSDRELWPRDEDSVRTAAPLRELAGSRPIKNLPVKAFLGGTVAATRTSNGVPIWTIYRSTSSEPKDYLKKLQDPSILMELAHFFPLLTNSSMSAILQIDRLNGRRHVYTINAQAPPRSTEQSRALVVNSIESPTAIGREVWAALERAGLALIDNAMRATPGQQCRTCDFGEFCRSHQDFGEQSNPFDSFTDATSSTEL